MNVKSLILPLLAAAMLLPAGCKKEEDTEKQLTVLTVGLPESGERTSLGGLVDGNRSVYWSNGDQMALNGTASNPLSGIGDAVSSAVFSFPGVINPPFNLLYPASFYKNSTTITLPANQSYVPGSFASNTLPMAGYANSAGSKISLSHLAAIVHLQIKKDADVESGNLEKITFKGNNGEQVCGDFTIDYSARTLTSASDDTADKALTMNLSQPLSESTALDIFLVVPCGTYSQGFSVTLEDAAHRTMTKTKSASIDLSAGASTKMPEFTFVPSSTATEFGIADIIEDYIEPDPGEYNVTGRVVDSEGKGLAEVVVSDGLKCVKTMPDGRFFMDSSIADVKFVYVSTPSGYMPQVSGGIPRFYKARADISPSDGVYDFGDFILTPMANPDHATILISADPQTRNPNWALDKVAYKSIEVSEDLYHELSDVAGGISGRQLCGICLGDIVHEDMSLFGNYVTALNTLGYPTYNIIGNHDNDPSASDDEEGAATFESYFGPRNYSFNIGGIHFVMLDNLIMKKDGDDLTGYDQGLSDRVWAWLQADMSFIPTSTKIMVCAHSPMFKQQNGSERTNTAYHAGTHSNKDGGAYGYGDLFDKYTEVHAWAGHNHSGFNYIYPSSHRHKRVQVHTLARSTGELWTNEYLANGTPRGFTVVNIDGGNITWKFHPLTRQTASFQGVTTGYCSAGAPAYYWRDWDYNSSGVAVMKNGGGALDETYQMHVYPRGAYGDDCVYANIFLYDEKWSTPTWTPTGGSPVEMTRLYATGTPSIPDTENIYDMADTEFRTWYKTHADKSGGSLKDLSGYTTGATDDDGMIATLFRVPVSASPSGGTVSVTDRFGNTYSRSISW